MKKQRKKKNSPANADKEIRVSDICGCGIITTVEYIEVYLLAGPYSNRLWQYALITKSRLIFLL